MLNCRVTEWMQPADLMSAGFDDDMVGQAAVTFRDQHRSTSFGLLTSAAGRLQ